MIAQLSRSTARIWSQTGLVSRVWDFWPALVALRFVCPLILFRCVVSVLWIHEIFLNPSIKVVAELVSVHCNLQNMEEMTHCFPKETYTKPWKAAMRPTFSAEMPQHKVETMYWCILAAWHGSLSCGKLPGKHITVLLLNRLFCTWAESWLASAWAFGIFLQWGPQLNQTCLLVAISSGAISIYILVSQKLFHCLTAFILLLI